MLSFTDLYLHLEVAVKNNTLNEVVNQLLEKELTPSNVINPKTGDTLLHFVATHGSLKLLNSVLREASVDEINCPNLLGETPLIHAVKARKQMVVYLLMNYQADPDQKDKQGYSALDYCQNESDFKIHCTKKIIWHLTECADELASISSDESFLNKLNTLQRQKVGLTDPVDTNDNSLLHLIFQYGSLKVINLVLSHINPNQLNITNANGDTPLHQACQSNCLIKTQMLIAKGADAMLPNKKGTTANSLIKDNKKLQLFLTGDLKAPENYIKITETLEKAALDNRIEEVILALTEKGLTFEEPIDHLDNSLLHWLMKHSPLHVIENLFKKGKIKQINVQNNLNETPLMIAAKLGRQRVAHFLIAHGADLPLTDAFQQIVCEKAQEEIDIELNGNNHELTLYEHLLLTFNQEKPLLDNLSEIEKAKYLFQKFIEFIRANCWMYDGSQRNFTQPFLLDCPVRQQYIVNCFDLACTFSSLLQAFGIKDVGTFVYKNIKSKPFSCKNPDIKGEFACFDKEVQLKSFNEGYFFYDNHCVVTCQGMFFDPTFCCYYGKQDDIVDCYKMEEEKNAGGEEHKDYIHIYANLDLADKLNTLQLKNTPVFHQQSTIQKLLPLKFIAYLQSRFPENEWHSLNRIGKIAFTPKKGNNYFGIECEDEEISFKAEEISAETLSDILITWSLHLPTSSGIVISIETNQNALGTLLKNQLITKGFDKKRIVYDPPKEEAKPLEARRILKVKRANK